MKEERFNEISNPQPHQNKKKPFGTQQRFSQEKKTKVAPTSYTIPTIFELGKFKNQGTTFSKNQQKIQTSDYPGPGQYSCQTQFQGPFYSIGKKQQFSKYK